MIASVLGELVQRLDDPDPARRRLAAETLGALGAHATPVVADIVERAIVDPEPRVRYGLLMGLERIGWRERDWVATFARLCEHPDEVAQARAAWALGRIG